MKPVCSPLTDAQCWTNTVLVFFFLVFFFYINILYFNSFHWPFQKQKMAMVWSGRSFIKCGFFSIFIFNVKAHATASKNQLKHHTDTNNIICQSKVTIQISYLPIQQVDDRLIDTDRQLKRTEKVMITNTCYNNIIS